MLQYIRIASNRARSGTIVANNSKIQAWAATKTFIKNIAKKEPTKNKKRISLSFEIA